MGRLMDGGDKPASTARRNPHATFRTNADSQMDLELLQRVRVLDCILLGVHDWMENRRATPVMLKNGEPKGGKEGKVVLFNRAKGL